ncbi:uncharacterized protein [Phaseolus vulgaris]|uniref:uncharacterized protein isoform X15 n=1 Tax=Phaseolus vulgaris TaxID=3885 RepID=UPI0035CA46BE
MEAETNSPEDASSKSVPLVKSIINIGNEEIIFPQKLGTEVNSEYPLVEEKGKADRKTDEVSEIRPQEIHQESCEVCVGSEKQAEVPSDWLKQRDSEGLVMTESIPKSSEHEHEPMSTIPELAINHSEMAEKICEEETYNEEEESTEIDDDKSCRPENDLGKRSKALEAIDQTQFMGKDTAVNEHADHQSEAPSMENVITKHSNSEEKLLAESSIKSNYEEEPLQKILELYSVDNSEIKIDGKVMPEKEIGVPADGTLKTLSTTECIGAEELEKKDEGKFAHEKAKEMEAATEMQLLERASADSPPENKDKSAVSTSEFVKGHTDEISQQQTHKNDETAVIDTGKSSAEPEGDEKLDKEAKAITQLLNTETESPPEEEVQPRLPTPDIVQQKTDQIIKQQSLNEDQPDVIDNAKSCIAENELDRVSTVIEEPVQLETKDNISIVKEQADQQSEETSMQSVTTNYIIEGHVISESTTKLTDDVHESHSIKNLERKDANEIREEATDVKQSIRKTEAKGISEDKALQTLFSAELVGSKTVEERCQEDIKPEAQLAVTYANEEQTPQHEFDTKKEIPEEEACQLTAENEPKSEPQIVAQNNETTCIKHPYLNGETAEINPTSDTVEQEITMSHTKEKLAIEDDKKFNLEEVQGTVKETKMQLQDTTTESVSKEEPIQPIARAGSVRTEAHDESSSEEIQPEANVTEKSNKEVLTSHVTEKEGIWDNGKCSQVEEAKTIEEPTKMQLQEEEVQTRSPTPASVEGDTNQIWQQEALYIDDSEVNDNAKQGYIPKIAQDIKLTIAQETEKPETMDNVRIVREKLDNKDVSDIRLQEGTDAKQLTDVEISKSETEGVSKDEAQQPITNRVLVGTEVVDEGSQEEKESEADVEVLSNKEEQRPEYVTGGTVEINTTSYTNENEEVPTSSVSAKEGIENDGKFSKEGESKGVEEKTKMQKQKSPTPAFVKGDTYQIPQQETLYIDSEVFDNAKQWCIPAIELDKKTTVVQETSNPETKDKVSVEAENLDHKDATEIKAEEGTYAQQLTDVEMLKSEREGMPIDEAQQPIANAVLVGSEALDESSQEEIPPQTYLKEKSNKEVPTPEYVTDEVVEINTSNYTEKQEVPKSHVEERERIGDKLNQEKVEGIEEATKMELLEEEVQMRSSTLASVQGDTNQILQKETLHVNESEVIQNGTIVQEIEVYETEDNAGRVIENLDNDASEIRAEEGMDAKQLTDLEMSKSETEGVPEDEVMQPISNAVQVRIEAVEESKQESQPKADATDKSNREVLIKKFVTEETAEINTNNYTEEQDTVQTSHANEQEGTMDDEKLHEEEAKGIEEKTKTQFPEEEFQTTSPIPAFIQEDSGQTSQQETLNIDESEVLDNDKQSCIPERELDGKSTVVQETNNPETKDNVSTGADNLDNKDEIEVTAEQGTCVEQLTNVEIPKSETKGVPKDEPLQPIANIVLVRTEAVNEGSQQGIQTQADVTQKSNKDVKTPEYVTAETIEKNTTNYNKEQEKVPSTPAKDEGIKTKFNHKEEANGIEEAAKIQSLEEEVQTKSPTPILIQGDNNQVPYKETLAVDRSEVIDNAKQSCITEIELDGGNSIVVQETEKPETKNNVNIRTRNFEDKDASEIKAEEGSYDKQVTEVERSKSLTEDVPEYEDPTEIEITVVVGAETVNDSNQEQIELDDGTEKKSNKEEQTPKYAADDTAQINTNNYPDEHDKDQTSHAKIKEGIDEEILDQMTKAKATVQSSKMHLPQEEIQTTSLTPAVVQGNTKQISQHELLHVDESEETIDYVKQSCIPEIELERRSTIAQETEKPESNDSISKITEMSATNDATKIRAEEETDSKTLADLKMQNSEIEEDQVRQPIVIITERVDDTKEEQIQLDKDITEKKPNKEEQTKQCVDDDTAEINTTSYTDQHDKVQTSDAEVKQGIEDDENLGRLIEDQATAESSKMQLPREEVLTISLTPACVQIDTEKILQQELLHVDESEGIDYVKQSCKEEIELGRNTTFAQETEKPETKDNNSKVTENSATSDATKVKAVEETDSKSLVNFKTNKSEIEEDQVRQPKGNAVGIVTERVNDTKDEEIQLDEDITQKKPNEEKQTTQCVDEETAEINTTSYTDQHDKVQTSDTEVKQGIEDDENLGPQIEDQATAESSKMQLPKEEVLTLTPASVQMDTEKILQQELLHVDESETIDYVKQSCKEEIELGRNTTFAQETEKPETKDNNSKVTENSATSDATKIKAEEGTDSRTLADFKTDKSEIEVDQVRQPIEISIAILTERVDDTKGEQIQLDEDITEKKPNEEEQTTQCVDEDTAEINTTSYIDQHDKVQTSDTEVKQGIEDDENLGPQIEDQATAESSKMQLPKEEVLTLTPASVQMDTEKILQQELLHVDESEAIDYVKQSCIEEIELGRNTTFAQETEKPETKDNISKVIENSATSDATKIKAEEGTDSRTLADFKTDKSEIEEDQVWQPIGIALTIVTERVGDTKEEQIQLDEDITEKKPNEEEQTTQFVDEDTAEINTTSYISKVTENSATSDATKIKAEEETDSKTLADFKTDKSEIEENQIRQPIGISVAIVTERVDDTKEEQIQLDEDITEKKPNEEEQTKQYVDDDTAKVNTTSYTDQHDKVQTSDAEVKQGIEDDENLGPQIEDQATAESSKMQLPKEEVLTLTPASVQMDTEKILQQELLHVDESETIDYVKQSCIEEIELGRNTTFAQETEKSETKDNISKVTENSATSDATKIKAEEETDSKTFADLKTDNSEIEENQIRQPIGIAVAIVTERVDDTKEEQIQLDEDITEKKPNEEEQTKQCVDDDTAKINTTSYTDQHDKVQTCDAEVKQGIEDDENFGPQIEDQATAESSKMQLPREEVLTISLTPAFVQVDTEQISQQELLHVDESEVIDYVKQCCIHEIELERKSTIAQETQKPKTKDSISKVTENLGSINARKIRAEEETYSKTLADFKTRNSEIEDQVRQPIVIVTERVDDTKEEQIQLDEDITEKKSNEEEQTTQYVAEDTAEIHTTSYIDQHDKVQTSDAEVKQEIENDENFGPQVEDQAIAESSKMKLPKEEVQTRSPSAGFVQHDTDKILQQELLELDQSEVIDYVMQSCIPEIEFDRKSIIAQETEKTETEDNISNVTENLGTNYESKVREEEETDVKKFVDLKMPKSEIAVVVGTETVDDSNQEQMRLEEDITEKKSNREEQTPQYVAEDTAEINTNNYTNEHDKVQTSDAEVKERIEDDEKFGQQEETKGIEETRKIQLLEKEVQTRSPTTAFVQGNSDQILQQELLHVDESEVIDYMKQSSLPEIQLDRKSTVVQETEKLNTKDNVGIVTEKLGTTDARKIRAELADFKMPKSEIEEVPEDEVPQPIAVAVAIRTETIDDINKKQIQLKEDITDKKSNKEQSPQYVVEDTAEINTNSYTDGHDKVQTSHAEVNQGIEGFGQEEEASGLEERNKRQLPKEEVQITSPTPAFVQRDTAQISQQELLHIDESEVIDYVKQSCIQEIELDIKSTTFQETEKPEAKDNVGIVTENIGTNDASEIKEKEETDAENLADLKMAESEIEGVPKEESLKPIPDTVFVENKAVIASQEKRQPQQEFVKKFNKEVQKPQYFTEVSAKIETTNDTEEPEEVPPSQPPKEKSGIKDDGKLEEEQEEKGIEEATKTQLQDKDIRTTLPIHTLIQGHFDQILQQQTLHDDESKGIGNAKKSCTHEMELDRESIIVEEPETKDNVNIIKQEQANNQSEKSSIQRGITDNITAEGLVTLESNRKISDDVCTDEQKTVKSCSTENLDNKNASEIRVEKSSEAKPSTYVEIIESKTQGEPEDKALQTRLNSSSNGNEGLDESSPEDRQTEAEFTENFNKDVQTPQRDTKVTAETNTATYPDKQQEAPASDANEKLGIQDEGKFDQEEAEGIEESIEKLLPEEEIQYTLPTPTSVQGDIDKMSQQQTLHDNEIEAINNAKSCMTEFELDRKSIVVEEPKPETKANVDFVKEEQADHQSEESSVQSFITNYLIVERHMTSESNKESSDDVDLDGHKKEESHLVEFLQIKDASEIRAKGIHTNQLTDIEIQKSETEGVAEDKGMQTMSSTTSGKNYASNECCQEEIQPQEEYVETHIKEVKTPYYEFDMQKQIPEAFGIQEDACQIMAENEKKLKSQLAPPNKETTFIDNLYSDGEIAKTNPINDIEKVVNPKSRTMEKSVIHDDSKFNEEKAKGIEEMAKIKLLDTATDSPQKEVQPKLPAPATVQGDTDQILQHQTLPSDASGIIDNDMRCIPENKLDRMSTVIEEPEIKANINIVEEEQSDKQSQEPSMQSLITEYITEEGHLASESNSKLSYDMNAKTVNLQVVENLGIKYGSKMTVEEVTDARPPRGVEVEKTKNEGVLDFKAKTLTNAELAEHETLYETNQETQPEEEFSGTYSKGKQTPQSSMESVITKHINSEGKEITESSTNSSYDEEEQEQVINTYTIENSEIKDGRKIMLEEASDIKEATDEPVDRAISIISPMSFVRIGIVDESIQEQIQMEVQPAVINTEEDQKPENDFVRNTEILEEFDLKKVSGNTCVENEGKVKVQSEANNQKTIKKHPNLEELETAETSPSSDTKELGKQREVTKLGGVSESVSVDITEHTDMGKLETQETENAISGNTKEDKAGDEFEKISPSSSVDVISRDSQDTGTKVLHKKSNGILSGVGSKVKHSISKVKKVITGKSSRPKTPPSSK